MAVRGKGTGMSWPARAVVVAEVLLLLMFLIPLLWLPGEVPAVQECTAFGAALLAGIGAGVYRNAEEAVQRTFRVGKTVAPRREMKDTYDRLYASYRMLSDTLYPINKALEMTI